MKIPDVQNSLSKIPKFLKQEPINLDGFFGVSEFSARILKSGVGFGNNLSKLNMKIILYHLD